MGVRYRVQYRYGITVALVDSTFTPDGEGLLYHFGQIRQIDR